MAKSNESEQPKKRFIDTTRFKRKEKNVDSIINQANLNMYGTTTSNNVADDLKKNFHDIMRSEFKDINTSNNGYSTFVSEILSHDNKRYANAFDMLNSSQDDMIDSMTAFIKEAYRNRLLEQHDINEVSTQIVDLQSAIEITKDAIISSNTTEGRINRTLEFDMVDTNSNPRSVVENMEHKFDLHNKIKNFIVPYTLTYGEYYVYAIPYAELFRQFEVQNDTENRGRFHEATTITEGFDTTPIKTKNKFGRNKKETELDTFLESVWNEAVVDDSGNKHIEHERGVLYSSEVDKAEFKENMKALMDNISVADNHCPLPILEEGESCIEYIQSLMNENTKNTFEMMTEEGGVYINRKKSKNKFDDIPDCYLSMLDPTKVIPMKMMNTTIGYCVILDDDVNPISGVISNNLYTTTFDGSCSQTSIIDALAERVVKSFNKPFLKKNIAFKKAIVDCFRYYNLNERKIRLQFIPAEYIVPFKIDRDIDDNGTSMLKKSLFWAKLYLMLLLFKIMSIILYSNDQKVSYVKTSGLDKNITNQIQKQVRVSQSRQINIADLFSYTTILNKVGNGNTMFIPVGQSGERGVETEILSGQDIQLNTELMEMLKNNMNLGTGVPPGLLNYMHEADYAKTIDENHSKFNAKVVNYQIDFNEGITNLYKKLMGWSTNLSEDVIEGFKFSFQPPRSSAGSTKAELINNHQASRDFIVSLLFPDPNEAENPEELKETIRIFSRKYAESDLQMFNYQMLEQFKEESIIKAGELRNKPDGKNGDNGDDDGFDDMLMDSNI